jgi:hypothetical protein
MVEGSPEKSTQKVAYKPSTPDIENFNTTSSGTSTGTAWQHAPGDPNASDNPQAVILGAGDQVLFRGGVRYQGHIVIPGRQPKRTGKRLGYGGL